MVKDPKDAEIEKLHELLNRSVNGAIQDIERLRKELAECRKWHEGSRQVTKMLTERANAAEAALATARRDALEEAAKRCDDLAFCEECHDCYDDLVRSAPYRRAAKEIRALTAAPSSPPQDKQGGNDKAVASTAAGGDTPLTADKRKVRKC